MPSDLTKGQPRDKFDELVRALLGEIGAHHVEMLRMQLAHIDHHSRAIERLDITSRR